MIAGLPIAAAQQRDTHSRLFPPEELGILEGPDRDEWQQPDRVMDALGIADGSRVADLGAGGGWFTTRLARRVGPNGIVYAEDIQREMIESIRRRVDREGLRNVRTILGEPERSAPAHRPARRADRRHLHAVPRPGQPCSATSRKALGPERAGSGSWISSGMARAARVRRSTSASPRRPSRPTPTDAGLKLYSRETFLRYQYLLVFTR